MKRQAIRGLVLLGLLFLVADSSVRAQTALDSITVRDPKDGSNKTYSGVYTLTPAGFQVVANDKKVAATVAPDEIVKFVIGDLQGVERNTILAAIAKEEKKEWDGARATYEEQAKKAGLPERSKRYLQFKSVMMANKIVDDLDSDKGWDKQAEKTVGDWQVFLDTAPGIEAGWEQWPAARACTRLQVELGKFAEASRTWARVSKNANMPPDARLEAAIQVIDLQVRAKEYALAATSAGELLKTAAGPRKDRLNIYAIAARAGADAKPLEGVDKIKAEMDKTKDASVHATGFSMMGELYLAGGKPRDAMWMFLWVETVMNQDKDEALRAMSRLAEIFKADPDQEKKYRDKLKRFRATF